VDITLKMEKKEKKRKGQHKKRNTKEAGKAESNKVPNLNWKGKKKYTLDKWRGGLKETDSEIKKPSARKGEER